MVDANLSGKCTRRPERVIRTGVGGDDNVGDGVDGVRHGESMSVEAASI